MKRFVVLVIAAVAACCTGARAADKPASPFDAFAASATVQPGLFPVWHKGDKVYLQIDKSQLDHDFLETIVPGNGLAGRVVWGDTDYLPSEIVRFQRRGDHIVLLWPNWYAVGPGSTSAQLANASNFPDSVSGTGEIAAENATSIVFDASSLLSDVLDMRNTLNPQLPPNSAYRLDPDLTYFEATKAFPKNDVITVAQTWTTDDKHVVDTAPDARRLRIAVVYNFAQLPDDNYRPRYADDRIGIYEDIYLDFANDRARTRKLDYLVRWNFDPEDPTRPSRARHPFVFTLSDTIPPEYRQAVSDGILAWNDAFAKIGILDAVKVEPQPNDPNWDPDDIRYNVIRWVTEAEPSFGADSQTLFDPRTGEEIRSGVLVSAEEGRAPRLEWRYIVDPARYGRNTDPVPAKFLHDSIFATMLHESGHNMGLQHNFIGSMAYTARELQDEAFTRKYGVSSSAMEYAPINLWPRGTPQGEYFQTTLGPYDYYVIRYAYAAVPGARSAQDEVPTLRRWASGWSDPRYRYASDEDVSWENGHAADPRVEQGDLTSNPLQWCQTQMRMDRSLIAGLPSREPLAGHEFEELREGLQRLLGSYFNCASLPAHWVGGQYISRAHRGDPHAASPVVPVSAQEQRQALQLLSTALFDADRQLAISPDLLQRAGYSERAGYGFTSWEGYGNLPTWAYDPPDRHDYALTEQINRVQLRALDYLLQAKVLARLDDAQVESRAKAFGVADLFAALRQGIFGSDQLVPTVTRRNLQIAYVKRLRTIASTPPAGMPSDAQALARAEIAAIHASARRRSVRGDATERAHFALVASLTR